MRHMVELFAGFGGQSEAFLEDGWKVLRIDNNPMLSEVPKMVIMDIEELEPSHHLEMMERIDYIHASPPCQEFSLAYNTPQGRAQRAGTSFTPSLDLVRQAKRIIDIVAPKYWSIENVKGSIKYIEPILGPPRLIVGAWVYWGNFPLFDPSMLELPTKSSQDKRWSPLRANYRAHIPLCVSQAFLSAIQQQKSILEF